MTKRAAPTVAATIAAAVISCGTGASCAQTFPIKPIRIIVPFAPGGGTTTMAHLVGDQLSSRLGQPIIILNREGAGGTIGATAAARATPDGYTWVLLHSGTGAIVPHLRKDIGYDPIRDFVPIGVIARAPLALVVPGTSSASSIVDLVALAKKQPGVLTYASGGVGTAGHLAPALFASLTDISIRHVPYKGSGPTIPDLLAGRVDLSLGPVVPFLPHVATGRLKALAVTGGKRTSLLPGTPTMQEAGVANYNVEMFYGLAAPSGTPRSIVDRLSSELASIVADPTTKVTLARQGGEPLPTTSEEYRQIMIADYQTWGKAVKLSGAKPE